MKAMQFSYCHKLNTLKNGGAPIMTPALSGGLAKAVFIAPPRLR